jgi:hypothetical protein
MSILSQGICYSTLPNPTINDKKTVTGSDSEVFSTIISGLEHNTPYFARAYVTDTTGTNYGNEVKFLSNVEFLDLKLGLFVHYSYFDITRQCNCSTIRADLTEVESLNELANSLDIPDLVQTAASMRAQYLIFTTFHSNMNMLYPSPVMNQYLPNHACNRDIISELITALKEKNIRLILYFHPSDGGDFTAEDQARVGWNDGAPHIRWNDFINSVLAEIMDRYGKDVLGYFMDGGIQPQINAPRLRKTIKDRNPYAWIIQNGNGTYNPLYADYGINEWDIQPPYPAINSPRCPKISNQWWANGGSINLSPELAYQNTVLQASVTNSVGGGIVWSFSPYPNGIWETGAQSFCQALAAYVDRANKSLFGTRPSQSFITTSGQPLTGTQYCATESLDGKTIFIHVFIPPAGKSITLPAPANSRVFTSAYLLANNHTVGLQQSASGVTLTLNYSDVWDSTDTIIVLA